MPLVKLELFAYTSGTRTRVWEKNMSMPDLVRCSSCDFEQMVTYYRVICRYHLSDAEVYEHHYGHNGWCRSCERVRDIESLPDLEVARGRLSRLLEERGRLRLPWREHFWAGKTAQRMSAIEDQISENLALINAFEHRSGQPHCLTCGSTDTQPGIVGVQHHCGGTLSLQTHPLEFRWYIQPVTYELDSEGMPLGD